MIRYRCCSCGRTLETEDLVYRCSHCSTGNGFQKGNLLVESLPGHSFAPGQIVDPLDLLPLDCRAEARAFPAGNTPLVKPEALCAEFPGLFCKMDSANPSGSLKDRASLLVAAQARSLGEKRVVLASTGNAGSAMSCAGAALDLDVLLFVPAAAPEEKLAQSLFFGASVVPVQGSYDDAFALSLQYSQGFGGINRNTAYNPLTIEGKKTAALEIYNQMGGSLPDLVYIPTGDGVIYTGLSKGFEDLQRLGLTDRVPRCIAVQAEGSDSLHQSFDRGTEILLKETRTLADSIAVCSPACGEPALQFLEKNQGWTVRVDDEAILQAQSELASRAGLFVEPSSASVWAGIQQDKKTKRIKGNESIVLLLTGSAFKDMGAVKQQIRLPDPVESTLEAAVEFLEKKGG